MLKNATGYHFTDGYRLRDGTPLPSPGVTLDFGKKEIVICKSGYHASRTPWQALKYAPGNLLSQVFCEDIVDEHENDKLVCRRRTIIKTINAEDLLFSFARKQALTVAHLWGCSDICRKYLETGDPSLRSAAWSAAESAASGASRSAAWSAAWSAAESAAEKMFNGMVEEAFKNSP